MGDWELAAAIARAVAATPGVVAVSAADPAAATYGPGIRVEGVCLWQAGAQRGARLHLVLGSFDFASILARARDSARGAAAARQQSLDRVDVHVEDVCVEAGSE